MAPESALKQMPDGSFAEVSIDEVDAGDILLVKTGARIPVDGTVLSGEGSVSEAAITGESIPVLKGEGDKVFAGTILDNGTIRIVADRVGEDTTFARIIELVEEAQDSKTKAERFIDRFARYYTPAVLVLGMLVLAFTRDPELAVTILVLGCPGALVIGVPVSNVAGIGNGARHGILFKGSEVISALSRVDTIVFDKTGTLTLGNPEVTEKAYFGEDIDRALVYLASVERESDHPLAGAVLDEIGDTVYRQVTDTEVIKGRGIIASVDGHRVAVGNAALMEREGVEPGTRAKTEIARFEKNGDSLVLTAVDGELKILMGVRDPVRPGAKEVLQKLKRLGVRNLVMLSGDNQGTVDAVGRELGLTEARGSMLPRASVRPSSRPTASTVPWLSPESITRFLTPSRFNFCRTSFAPGRTGSRTPIRIFSSPSTAVSTSESPFFSNLAISVFARVPGSTPSLSISAALPTATLCPSTLAMIPRPFITSVSVTWRYTVSPISSRTAPASGWSDSRSTLARYTSALSMSSPKYAFSVTSGLPRVNVPVLSKTIVSTLLRALMTSLPLKRMPWRAPFPMPATLETGTPITRAPGQPRTRIVTASSGSRVNASTSMPRTRTAGV